MLKENGSKIKANIILDKDLKEKAEAEAQRLGLNLSAYIRMVLAERLK